MEVLNESSSELEVGTSTESFQKFLDSQRELFHSQVDQLQNIVVKQCKLTGVNPLSQEMAAGAFSVKIGKKPRDLLNPKAVKYMHSVFSIKDAVSKKESREISALFGVTVTQVRDFFASQRSRVRKFVRLSREKVVGPKACKEQHDGHTVNSDSTLPIAPVPLNSVGPPIASVPLNSVGPPIAPVPLNSVGPIAPVPLNSATPPSTGEVPCCSTSDEVLPGIDDFEKHFVDNIFNLMRKEESFSGQVKLMEWILTLQNSSVLSWFLSKGGVMILATWLSQAAIEEQTSVLLVILKVLCHLPLHKALPVHMSAILQSVNRLRFYRAQDISNRARVLLSRWSKIFARSQAMKNPNAAKTSSDMHNERLLKQSIGEIMNDESWQSKADLSVQGVSPLYEISENSRKLEPPQVLKLLPASSDDSNRKHIRGASMTQTRERRKVQLVEQPGQKTAARSSLAFRAVPVSRGRPMSADDIQKAKTRALVMQSKYGKLASASSGSSQVKNGGLNKPSSSQSSVSLSVPRAEVQIKNEEHKDSPIPPSKISDQQLVAPLGLKPNLDSKEPSLEKGDMVQIPWHTPPEIRINSLWRVGGAENSKEVEVQKNRIRREKETVYEKLEDIPPGPREPWDLEMDYDDSLTLEIPTEQLPDPSDGAEPSVPVHEDGNGVATSEAGSSQISNLNAAEPDLELLAVLLKNPELVFSLTSGQGGGMSNEETVKLLDMIKAGTVCLPGNSNGVGGKGDERVEVSLPSPTPSSNPSTSGWRPEIAKNPFTQRDAVVNRAAYASSSAALAGYAMENVSANNMIPTQLQSSTAKFTVPQFPATVPPEMRPISRGPSLPHLSNPTNSPVLQIPVSELGLNMNNNLPLAYSNPMPITKLNKTERFPAFSPSPSLSQMHLQQPTLAQPTSHFEKQSPAPDSWRSGHGSALKPASQLNEYGYNVGVRGPVQPQAQPGHWERGDFAAQGDFHTWSSECSPTRPRRNLSPQPGTSPSRYHRPLDRSQPRDSLRYRDQNSRHGDRRWRDRDRDWRR